MYRSKGTRESPAPRAEAAKVDGRTVLGLNTERESEGKVAEAGRSL